LTLAARRLCYPFFMDEIWVLRGVQSGHRDITPPLLYGFLRGLSAVWPIADEWVMRLPSLLAVTLSAVLLPGWALLRRWPVRMTTTAWLTGSLLALSSPVLFYGAFVKIYALDVLFSVFMIGMWIELDHTRCQSAYWLLYLAVCGLFLSTTHTAIFVVAGFFTAFAWRWLFSGNRSITQGLIGGATHALLGLIFLCSYYFWLRLEVSADTAHDPIGLDQYWSNRYWDGSLSFVLDRSRAVFGHQFNLVQGAWLVVFLHVAIWVGLIVWHRWWRALGSLILAVVPIALVLLASFFQRYPYGEVRLMLFSTPLVYVLFALAVSENLKGRSWLIRSSSVLTAAFLMAFGLQALFADPYNTKFMGRVDDRPLHMLLRDNAVAGEAPIFTGEMESLGLDWYVNSSDIKVLPLADASKTYWNQAWFVVNMHGWEDEWSAYALLKKDIGFDEVAYFSHRPGLRAMLVRRQEKTR